MSFFVSRLLPLCPNVNSLCISRFGHLRCDALLGPCRCSTRTSSRLDRNCCRLGWSLRSASISSSVLSARSSNRPSQSVCPAPPKLAFDSQDVDLDSGGATKSSTSRAQNGDSRISTATLGGCLVVCSLLFPLSSSATAAMESSIATMSTFAGNEPSNALSLPTWIIHVASVVEWVTAMALVWNYGDVEGNSAWKGLTWGMVPLLGGAMCACTWHFFYNAESLEVLVVLQAFLTVVGNFTMWAAAFRIWRLSQENMSNN